MKKIILVVFVGAVIALLLSLTNVLSASSLMPPAFFAAAMILAMLQLIAESDWKQ